MHEQYKSNTFSIMSLSRILKYLVSNTFSKHDAFSETHPEYKMQKNLVFVINIQEKQLGTVSYAHQGCIYLIKKL